MKTKNSPKVKQKLRGEKSPATILFPRATFNELIWIPVGYYFVFGYLTRPTLPIFASSKCEFFFQYFPFQAGKKEQFITHIWNRFWYGFLSIWNDFGNR